VYPAYPGFLHHTYYISNWYFFHNYFTLFATLRVPVFEFLAVACVVMLKKPTETIQFAERKVE